MNDDVICAIIRKLFFTIAIAIALAMCLSVVCAWNGMGIRLSGNSER